MFRGASDNGADVIMLPEAFSIEYTEGAINQAKEPATEEKHGETYTLL